MGPSTLVWIALPGVVCALLLLSGRPQRKQAWAGDRYLAPAALGIAYVAGHFALFGVDLTPHSATHWLPHVALIGVLTALIAAGRSRGVALAVGVVATTLGAYVLLRPLAAQMSGARFAMVLAAIAAAATLAGALLTISLAKAKAPAGGALLFLVGAVTAALCGASGTITIGQFGGLATSAFAGLAVAAWLYKRPLDLQATVPVVVALLGGAITLAFFYAEMRVPVLGLLVALPIALALLHQLIPKRKLLAQLGATVLLGAIAGWQAFAVPDEEKPSSAASDGSAGSAAATDDYGYGYDYDD